MRARVINVEPKKWLTERDPRITGSKIAEILAAFTPAPTPAVYQFRGPQPILPCPAERKSNPDLGIELVGWRNRDGCRPRAGSAIRRVVEE